MDPVCGLARARRKPPRHIDYYQNYDIVYTVCSI
jgi:hypothetical protein